MNHEDMNSLQVLNPFTGSTALGKVTAGGALAALQSREDTEVLAMVAMAKRFPRNQVEAMDRILNAFARPSLAEQAQYQYARGGSDITGPSIRAAEAIAQEWGNIKQGWMELERGTFPNGTPYSLVRAYALDLQTTNVADLVFYVPHWRDTKKGGYALKDERDIYELCANQAQRRKRACILALIPGDVVEQAMNQAAVTLKTSADVSPEAQKKRANQRLPEGLAVKPLRPVFDQIRLAWLRFLRDSQNPMSPFLHRTVIRINRLEHRNRRP